MPDRMPEDMPDKMLEDMSDRMPEDLPVTRRIDVMVAITRSKVIYFDTFCHMLSLGISTCSSQSHAPSQHGSLQLLFWRDPWE